MPDNKIKFIGPIVTGECNIDEIELICIPSKPKYGDVDICIKGAMHIPIGIINRDDLSFEDSQKIGYELVRRWNNGKV